MLVPMLVPMLFLRFAYVYAVLKFNIIISFGGTLWSNSMLCCRKRSLQMPFFTMNWNICETVL